MLSHKEIVCQIKDFVLVPACDCEQMRGLAWSDHEHPIWNSNEVERTGETVPPFIASDKVNEEGRPPWPFFCPIFISLPVWRFGCRCNLILFFKWSKRLPFCWEEPSSHSPQHPRRHRDLCNAVKQCRPACSLQQALCPTLPPTSWLKTYFKLTFDTSIFSFR